MPVEVPTGVDEIDRVIDDIAVAVVVLGVISLADEGVWAEKSAKLRIIVPAAIVECPLSGSKRFLSMMIFALASCFCAGCPTGV